MLKMSKNNSQDFSTDIAHSKAHYNHLSQTTNKCVTDSVFNQINQPKSVIFFHGNIFVSTNQ